MVGLRGAAMVTCHRQAGVGRTVVARMRSESGIF